MWCFSNKASSLLSFVEDYDQKNLLKDNPGFKNAFSYLNSSSTVFLYTDVHKFYYQLKPMMNAVTWGEIQSDKDIVYSFPYGHADYGRRPVRLVAMRDGL